MSEEWGRKGLIQRREEEGGAAVCLNLLANLLSEVVECEQDQTD